MAHTHDVTDTDKHFVIDPINRSITNQSGKVKLMQFDHNSERLSFEIPRLVDGHDMSLCTEIAVHFINTSSDKQSFNKDVSLVSDARLSEESEDLLVFSWLVPRSATQLVGLINFIIRFSCKDNGEVDYVWSTDISQDLSVANSIDSGEQVIIENYEVLEAWKKEIIAGVAPITDEVRVGAKAAEASASNAKTSETNAAASAEIAETHVKRAEAACHEIHGEILKSIYGSESGAILYVPYQGYAYNLSSDVTGHNPETLRAMFFRDSQVYQINGHTFNGCSKLSYIDKFPSTLHDLHGSAFAYCGFSSIEIDCVNIQNRAFRGCPNLSKVIISDRVEKIFEYAFFECRKLDYVKIGCGVKSIGTGAFKNCMTDGSWQPLVIDMTAFTHGTVLPTLEDSDSFPSTVVIKVVKGRRAELETMTNWNVWGSAMVEVDAPGVDSDKIINFNLDYQGYTAESGMTWEEWLNSKYNVYGYTARFNLMTNSDTVCVRDNGDGSFICIGLLSVPVSVTDTIEAGLYYISEWVEGI